MNKTTIMTCKTTRATARYALALVIVPLLVAGCATTRRPPPPATTQDFSVAASELAKDIQTKGFLDKVPNPPAKIRVLALVNNTSEHFDTDLVTHKLREILTQSTKAVTVLNPELPVDFVFSGKIISTYVRTKKARERTFTFQLTVSDPQGTAVWEGGHEFTK